MLTFHLTLKKEAFLLNTKKIALPAAAVVFLAICFITAILLTPSERSLKNPEEFYQTLCQQLALQELSTYEAVIQSVARVQGQEFTETITLIIQHQNIDGQPSVTIAERNVSMGDFQFSCTERLEGTTLYIDLNGSRFSGELTTQMQYPPELLLTAQNYSSITGIQQGNEITLEFSGASAAEDWVLAENATIQSASGTLTATKDGKLLQNTYRITYQMGENEVSQTITVSPRQEITDLANTFDSSAYTAIANIEAPILLERMSGYLLQAKSINSSYQEYIYCQTFGDQRKRDMQLELRGTDPFEAVLTTNAALLSSSRGESESSMQQKEVFENGKYTRESNGSDPITDESVTAQHFQTHCHDILVGTILLPQFISTTSMEEDEHSITYHFTPTQQLATLLCEEASQNLYQDSTVLSSLASSSATEVLSAYLQIDKNTGLPLSSGIHYTGIYTITELPYRMEYTTDQSYSFPGE